MLEQKKMFYDTFSDSYVAEIDAYAPPERYIETHRGGKGIYLESWLVKREDGSSNGVPLAINVAYLAEEYYDDAIHNQKLTALCNRSSVVPVRLRYFALPEEKFDEYAKRFGIVKERRKNSMNETVPIISEKGILYCDACGCEIKEGQEICDNCKRKINWDK